MKILALDVGDAWTGTAISDELGFIARPYKTVKSNDLIDFLEKTLTTQNIGTVVVGLPRTMKGHDSQQTIKVRTTAEQLEQKFTQCSWIMWDERLSSKRAANLTKPMNKEEKIKLHSVAAAFILDSYLQAVGQ
ncbi:Holliday junction resolvase RuvX [bacterium]|jgi:putative holliday junction resolvase|nr:Holliday junction resolvase RuvX [bacterium]MBT3903847.1 Holliday junction resolvase RuvX [bacterium]MBT4577715.1 Holliday junction resolvase RuvX [bacterium]MBT5345609.1 Holliday junction resolvase RuvX [bacterium]MBT6130704.1 Holliday junction resolvase RuvX [bacterium]